MWWTKFRGRSFADFSRASNLQGLSIGLTTTDDSRILTKFHGDGYSLAVLHQNASSPSHEDNIIQTVKIDSIWNDDLFDGLAGSLIGFMSTDRSAYDRFLACGFKELQERNSSVASDGMQFHCCLKREGFRCAQCSSKIEQGDRYAQSSTKDRYCSRCVKEV